jgi:AcrR family transcriptional regulator
MARPSTAATVKKPKREPLSRERIAQAALAFIDRWGLEELSTRRLGAQLGVEGMALYKHFTNRDEILDAVAELLIVELQLPAEGPKWTERVRDFARRYRSISRVHPRAYPLLATRQLATPRAVQIVEQLMAGLMKEGLSPDDAVLVFRTIGNFCNGTALEELAVARRLSLGTRTRGEPGTAVNQLDAAMHPLHFDRQFEEGLTLILDGFEKHRREKKK